MRPATKWKQSIIQGRRITGPPTQRRKLRAKICIQCYGPSRTGAEGVLLQRKKREAVGRSVRGFPPSQSTREGVSAKKKIVCAATTRLFFASDVLKKKEGDAAHEEEREKREKEKSAGPEMHERASRERAAAGVPRVPCRLPCASRTELFRHATHACASRRTY